MEPRTNRRCLAWTQGWSSMVGSLKLLLFEGCYAPRSRGVEKPPTGGRWQLGGRVKFPKSGRSKACSRAHHLAPAPAVGRLWGLVFSDSNSGMLAALACGSASRPTPFVSVSKAAPPAFSHAWELPKSLLIMFFLPKVLELE